MNTSNNNQKLQYKSPTESYPHPLLSLPPGAQKLLERLGKCAQRQLLQKRCLLVPQRSYTYTVTVLYCTGRITE